ncbi:MAG: aspartate--tRNA ligase [Candidatus Doudnabacteria bacterium]|nr:aspartate--tRNA ligase [Candidatus Doudnabacteria bacterium]
MQRTYVSETPQKIGEKVLLQGWVNVRRDHGKLIFFDLRDMTGILQLVVNPKVAAQAHKNAQAVRSEYVLAVEGTIKKRNEKQINNELPTGKIELEVSKLTVLNKSETLPFEIDNTKDVNEEKRLKYRYLDLRSERMKKNLKLRHKVIHFIRNYLTDLGFTEVQTPILTKSTPEGARDYLVPSRIYPGKFFALPQSPQQYKQLLMVAGLEKYFQIAPCFRDEDARADRSPGEFYQLDLEVSFVEQNDILELIEKLFTALVQTLTPEKKITQTPWPRISHREAKTKYDSDKPDLRKNKQDPNELAFCWVLDFPLFTEQSEEDFFYGSGESKWAPSHHMFTAPHPDDISLLVSDPGKARGLQHDLVLNGVEIGGGSIRIHDPKIQEKIFELIGFTPEQKKQFSHMLEAFTYGVPPHGGIAPGIDRLIRILASEERIAEVIAFPLAGSVSDPMMGSPSEVTEKQLKELHLKVEVPKKKKKIN